MKAIKIMFAVLAFLLTACVLSNTQNSDLDRLPVDTWSKIVPGGDTRCIHNTAYAFWVRPSTEKNKLLIYFQGGGYCIGKKCENGNYRQDAETDPASMRGIFDFSQTDNPFATYNIVFIPYCTGDFHWGDKVDVYEDVDGTKEFYHKGYVNAESALNWVYENYSNPESIFVTGGSAGSVGSILHAAHIATHYPNSMVTQLGDSAADSPPLDFDALYAATKNLPNCPKINDLSLGSFTLAQFYIAVANCYPDQNFSQFNFAYDWTQQVLYNEIGGIQNEQEIIMKDHIPEILDEIDAKTDNFYYFTVLNECPEPTKPEDPSPCHTILTKDMFHKLKIGETFLRNWVQDLMKNRRVPNIIDCGIFLGFPCSTPLP